MELQGWQEETLKNVHSVIKTAVVTWGTLINELGVNDESRVNWVSIFEKEVKTLMDDIIQEVSETKLNLIEKIQDLLKQSVELHIQLSLDMPVYEFDNNMGLYNKESELLKEVGQLQKQVDLRLVEINALIARQDEICRTLGEKAQPIPTTPLPSADEIEAINKRIEALETEKFLREEKFTKLKFEITEMVLELNRKPALDFEKMVLSVDDGLFTVTNGNMLMLEEFYESVHLQLEDTKQEIAGLRETLESLWEILVEDRLQCDQFLRKHPGNSLDTLEALKTEIKRCEALKKANIQVFILKLRDEIAEYWEKCGFTDDQREAFEYFNDDLYTEDLLTLHDLEKTKLKKFYADNSELFKLLEKREELWSKLQELEESANAKDRLKNRGGKLLMEEKERNALSKRIPKIEERLRELALAYEEDNDTEFLFWGVNIESIIQRSYENRDIDKKTKLSVRKQQRELTVTPGKSCLSIASSASMQNLRFTPMKPLGTHSTNIPLSAKRPIGTPLTTVTQKRQMKTPMYSASATKKAKCPPSVSSVTKTAPPKVLLNNKTILKSRVRHSSEKKKKMDRLRRMSKLLSGQTTATGYEFFEKGISSLEGSSRSTLHHIEVPGTPLAKPLPCTPLKTPRLLRTPHNRPGATPRSTRIARSTTKLAPSSFNFLV